MNKFTFLFYLHFVQRNHNLPEPIAGHHGAEVIGQRAFAWRFRRAFACWFRPALACRFRRALACRFRRALACRFRRALASRLWERCPFLNHPRHEDEGPSGASYPCGNFSDTSCKHSGVIVNWEENLKSKKTTAWPLPHWSSIMEYSILQVYIWQDKFSLVPFLLLLWSPFV